MTDGSGVRFPPAYGRAMVTARTVTRLPATRRNVSVSGREPGRIAILSRRGAVVNAIGRDRRAPAMRSVPAAVALTDTTTQRAVRATRAGALSTVNDGVAAAT